uniref:histidine kinase n=1 Tax=Paracoccus sp. TaxID=267 RepID=UPI0028AE4B0D
MIQPGLVLAVSFGYLLLLVAVAAHGDRRAGQGRSLIDNSLVYALSWGVYCSAWTYFGSVGRAASGGVWFLPIYLGPMLAMLLAWLVLRKMVRIARSYRITSIADFIASRYGKSPLLAALVTLITVVGILPYIALQLKAVSAGYEALIGGHGQPDAAWWRDGTLYMALSLAGFAVVFGTRHLDLSERHEGMVAAIAFESAVKLGAFLVVGIFVTYGLFGGMGDIWARAQAQPDIAGLLHLGGQGFEGFQGAQWFALTLLSMLSVLLLPRQFQMMVVECVDERHILRASWMFPAYLLLINIFVLPIAIGGMLIFGDGGAGAESYVLTLPLSQGVGWLALLAYLGGLSAATGMIIVETVAVSTMVCNDLVMPALLRGGRFARTGGDLTRLLLNIRRAAILLVLLLGYLYFRVAGEAYALVSIGLISFAAVAQFAPALLGGMYWQGGTRAGALGGLLGGSLVWAYTLMLPSVARSGWIPAGFLDGPFGFGLLAPQSLFGLGGFDDLTHSLFWSLLVNISLYVGLSLTGRASAREASQALLFVDVFQRGQAQPVFWRGRARLEDLRRLAGRFLGAARAEAVFRDHARETGTALDSLT